MEERFKVSYNIKNNVNIYKVSYHICGSGAIMETYRLSDMLKIDKEIIKDKIRENHGVFIEKQVDDLEDNIHIVPSQLYFYKKWADKFIEWLNIYLVTKKTRRNVNENT